MTSAAMAEAGDRFGLGPVDQVSFAVASVDDAVASYEAVFGAPFTVRTVQLDGQLVQYRGEPADTCLKIAFGRSGDLEIELVEVISGPAPTRDHLREHGEGLHHVRFAVTDLDAVLTQLCEAGFEVVFGGETPRGSRFSYVSAPDRYGHTAFELIQRPGDRAVQPEVRPARACVRSGAGRPLRRRAGHVRMGGRRRLRRCALPRTPRQRRRLPSLPPW